MRVLLVDDKEDERAALKSLIDWEALGFTVVGEAGDGIVAWEMMRSLAPDIIITDIVMPMMDGFELIRKTLEVFPSMRFIIVSCHDQFRYAQAALRYHVTEYLLKPVIASELTELLERIKRAGHKQTKEDDSLIEQYMTSIQQALVKQLLEHPDMDLEEVHLRLKRCGLDALTEPPYAVFAGHVSPDEALDEAIASMYPWFPDGLVVYPRDKSSFIALGKCEEDAIIVAGRLCNDARENERFVLTLGAAAGQSLGELPDCREAAEMALDAAFDLGYGRAIDGQALPYPLPNNLDVVAMDQRIQQILQTKDDSRAEQLELELSKSAPASPHTMRAFAVRVVNACQVALLNLHQTMQIVGYDEMRLYEQIFMAPERSVILSLIKDVLMSTRAYLGKTQSAHANQIVARMEKVMRERYSEKLTIGDIASVVHLHPVYASAMFKQVTGMTCMKYLTDIRMQKAMELLRKSLYVYEVCEKVGYWNRSYFTMAFKEYTGMTPREYSNACQKEE